MTSIGMDAEGAFVCIDNITSASDYVLAHPYITSLNGIRPTADGNLFINGSECESIWISGSTIGLYDLCPACQKCDKLYTLIQGVQYYKTWLNTLKDVNLYATSQVTARQNVLLGLFADFSAPTYSSCSTSAYTTTDFTSGAFSTHNIIGRDLLRQYVTTVHMWNYLVSRSGNETSITVAPEDNSGFVVQTKYTLPACDQTAGADAPKIACKITIKCTDYPESENIRVVKLTNSNKKLVLYKHDLCGSGAIIEWAGGTITGTGVTERAEQLLFYTKNDPDFYSAGCVIHTTSALTLGTSGGTIYSTNPLSLYIPDGAVSFTPFDTTLLVSSRITRLSGGTHSDIDRQIDVFFGSSGSVASAALPNAGTYQASVKFLPFIHTEVWLNVSGGSARKLNFENYLDYWNTTNMTSGSAAVISGGQTVSAGVPDTYYLGSFTVADVLDNPKLYQYEGAKMYPSKSPRASSTENIDSGAVIRWSVDIEWTTNLATVGLVGGSASYQEHYVYETAGVREYVDGLFLDTDLQQPAVTVNGGTGTNA